MISNPYKRIRQLEAELSETTRVLGLLSLQEFHALEDRAVAKFAGNGAMVLANMMAQWWFDHGGTADNNYVEGILEPANMKVAVELRTEELGAFTLTMQRRHRPTPHDLRVKAESELAAANAEIARLKGEDG